ncbi:MAG: prenyltransferase [Zoogloeaceae bacterium]|nr:prenyltransferase [Zoogloeaceae bacterium]
MPVAEPSLARLSHPLARYVAATRPPFLTVTLAAFLIGVSTATFSGFAPQWDITLVVFCFALAAHGAANVINDFHDAANGTDSANVHRLYPFTGGSRMIDNGVLSATHMGAFGYLLLAAVVPAGLWLMWRSTPELFWIGLAGMLVVWSYSAPPIQLMCRGLGEFGIAAGWTLIAAGTDMAQRGGFSVLPWLAGFPYALLVVNILYINQFPDREADEAAGKRTLIVRLGAQTAKWGYLLIAALSYGLMLFFVGKSWLPIYAAAGAFALPFSFHAARGLIAHATEPEKLRPAIVQSVIAANLSGVLTALGMFFSR